MSSTSCQFDHWVLPASQQKRSAATAPALPQRPPQRGGSPWPPEHRSKHSGTALPFPAPSAGQGGGPAGTIPPQRRHEGSLTAGACLCERPVRPEERQATSALLGLHLQGAVWWKRGHVRPRSKYEIHNIEHQNWCWNANANPVTKTGGASNTEETDAQVWKVSSHHDYKSCHSALLERQKPKTHSLFNSLC